jgi:hypothetical protein
MRMTDVNVEEKRKGGNVWTPSKRAGGNTY